MRILKPSFKALTFFFPAILLRSNEELVVNFKPAFFALIGSSTQKPKSFLISFNLFIFSVLPNT